MYDNIGGMILVKINCIMRYGMECSAKEIGVDHLDEGDSIDHPLRESC